MSTEGAEFVVIRGCDGVVAFVPKATVKGRKQWLRTWFGRDLIALPGARASMRVTLIPNVQTRH